MEQLSKEPTAGKQIVEFPGKRVFSSEDLFRSQREIVIVHGQAQYRLQITKAGKLILNK